MFVNAAAAAITGRWFICEAHSVVPLEGDEVGASHLKVRHSVRNGLKDGSAADGVNCGAPGFPLGCEGVAVRHEVVEFFAVIFLLK